MAKSIAVGTKHIAIVSDSDFENVRRFKWCEQTTKTTKTVYAKTSIYLGFGKQQFISMHRMILETPYGFDIDHIDGNGLNNQRSNLRIATRAQNLANSGLRSCNVTGYKGISWYKKNRKWGARLSFAGRNHWLGLFRTKEEAAKAYQVAANSFYGEYLKVR